MWTNRGTWPNRSQSNRPWQDEVRLRLFGWAGRVLPFGGNCHSYSPLEPSVRSHLGNIFDPAQVRGSTPYRRGFNCAGRRNSLAGLFSGGSASLARVLGSMGGLWPLAPACGRGGSVVPGSQHIAREIPASQPPLQYLRSILRSDWETSQDNRIQRAGAASALTILPPICVVARAMWTSRGTWPNRSQSNRQRTQRGT
jgi:hypothetical protein